MKLALLSVAIVALAACGGGGGGGGGNPTATGSADCSLAGQKQFVLDWMRDIYFWNDSLPVDVDISQFATPEELLDFLTSFQPLDSFSFINSAAADAQFFGEGRFAGFGFGYAYDAMGDTDTSNDAARFLFVYADSPAARAGFERGQRILAIDGETLPNLGPAGLANAFGPSQTGVTRRFRIGRLDGTEFEADLIKDVVTIDPVPQYRVIDTAGAPVGYLELSTFISTADPQLSAAFTEFLNAGVNDLVLDLRYNGGGLVSTAEGLGDRLGGQIAAGLVFSKTLFNAQNQDLNSVETFRRLGSSLSLSRLVVIATRRTASASELVINALEPYAEVVVVGEDTFGKPVGQVGIEFCEKILRPTAFEKVNALDQGGFFDGLPRDCNAPDDLDIPIGADEDPALQLSLGYLASGACPAGSVTATAKAGAVPTSRAPVRPRSSWEAYAGAH